MVQVLRDHAVKVYEVNRSDRSQRRLQGKSDPLDAENAARAVLAGRATAIPKEQSGVAEALRIASGARRSAIKSKTQAINQLQALLVSAPDDIRTRLWRSKPEACIAACTRLRSLGKTPHLQVLMSTLRALAKRWRCLT
ncbi:transposase [Vreelandella venusta]